MQRRRSRCDLGLRRVRWRSWSSTIGSMTELSRFPITAKWPAQDPERIQLYSMPTPNGVKVSIMLEETGLAYEPHRVSFDEQANLSPEFASLNPYGKIP